MNDIKLLGFSGRKQSGKNTCANFILGLELVRAGVVANGFNINSDGQLEVADIFGDTNHAGVFDISRNTQEMKNFLSEHVYPFIKLYSFADILKSEVCIKILGLTYEQCYGSDKDKNSLTKLKWEDMPGVTVSETPTDVVDKEVAGRLGLYYEKVLSGVVYHKPGFMTAREVLQFVGTEIFRKMYRDVWAEATIRRISEDNPIIAIITDVRFPNEVNITQKYGGKVIRLDRLVYPYDKHESEIILDRENFDWKLFDYVCENHSMNIGQQNEDIYKKLQSWGWYDSEISEVVPPISPST